MIEFVKRLRNLSAPILTYPKTIDQITTSSIRQVIILAKGGEVVAGWGNHP